MSNLATIITSQHYLDDSIVAKKIADGDFSILVSPEFEVDGSIYRVLLDGHHSLAAAINAGHAPDIAEATIADHDAVALLPLNVEDFLSAVWMDGEYIFAANRKAVW